MKRGNRFLVRGATALVLATLAMPAFAEAAEEATDPSAASGQGEIVVTASRRDEALKNVASSVTAIGGPQLQNLLSNNFDDFVGQIPNISFAGNGRGNRLVILRGINTSSNDQSATVATYIDDIPVTTVLGVGSRFTPDVDTFDLDRIEVLRGPQGTLYGANSLGGLLKYVTQAPNLEKFEAFGRVEGTSTAHGGDGYAVNAGVNIPLNDKIALRVSGFDNKEGGWIDNLALGKKNVNDLKSYGGHASLLFKATDRLTLKATAFYQHYRTGGESTVDTTNINTGALAYGPFDQYRSTPEPQTQKFQLYSLSANYDLGFANLNSSTSYNITDTFRTRDYTQYYAGRLAGIPLYQNSLDQNTKKFTQEVKLASSSNHKLEWIVGAFYTHEKSDGITIIDGQTSPGVVGPGDAGNLYFDNLYQTYTQIAGYGDVTLYLGKIFDITGGIRYSHDKITFVDSGGGIINGGAYLATPGPSKDNSTTFLVTPRIHISDATMIYGRVATGFRPGGPNNASPAAIAAGAVENYGADKLTNYEIGIKTSALDHKLTFDASAFYIDWKDIQIRTSAGGFYFIGNAGKATSKGFEMSAAVHPVSALSISFNMGYTDAKLTQDALAIGALKGDALPNVPKVTIGGAVDYSFDLTSTVKGSIGAAYRVVGDRLTDFNRDFSKRYSMDGYGTLDLRAGVKFDHYDVDLFAKNVTNTYAYESAITNFTPSNLTVIRPRTIGIALTARY